MNFYLIRDTSKTWIGTFQKNKNLNKEIDLGNLKKLVYWKDIIPNLIFKLECNQPCKISIFPRPFRLHLFDLTKILIAKGSL